MITKLFATMHILLLFAAFFLGLSWLLPTHFLPWLSIYQEILAALSLGLALLAFAISKQSLRIPKVATFIMLLATVPWLQYQFDIILFAGDAWLSAAFIILLALSITLGANLSATQPNLQHIVGFSWLLIFASALSTIIAIGQWFGLQDLYWVFPLQGTRPYANMAQPNNLATLLGFGLASVWLLYELKRLNTRTATALAALLILGLAVAESRTTWVTMLFILPFWHWKKRTIKLRLSTNAMWLWAALFVFLIFSLPIFAELLELTRNDLLVRAQRSSRLDIYIQGLIAIKEGPWFGYGWNQVSLAQAAVSLEHPIREHMGYYHNVLIDLLIWNGPILGGLIIVASAIWFTRLLLKANNTLSVMMWIMLSFFIMHSMLEFPHAYAFFVVPAGIMLGILISQTTKQFLNFKLPAGLQAGLGLAILGSSIWVWNEYVALEEDYKQVMTGGVQTEFSEPLWQSVEQAIFLDHLASMTYFYSLPLRGDYSPNQLELAERVAARYPHSFFMLKAAYLLTLNGHADKAHYYLLLLSKIYGPEKLAQVLEYLLDKAKEEPKLLELTKQFGVQYQGE